MNKKFKYLISKELERYLELKQPISISDVAECGEKSVSDVLKPSIISSWRHVGIYPFDCSKIEEVIKDESPDEAFLNHPAYKVGIQMAFDKIEETDHVVGEKRKRDDEEGPPPKKPKGVDTSFAVNLTEPHKIVYLCERKERVGIKKMKVKS